MFNRKISLSAPEVVRVLSIIRTIQALPTNKGQEFMTLLWFTWRQSNGVSRGGTDVFFDLYFTLYGNFDQILNLITRAIPPVAFKETEMLVAEIVEKSVKAMMAYQGKGPRAYVFSEDQDSDAIS